MPFVVLPDTVAGERLAARLPGAGRRIADHPSGRPWLVGDEPPRDVLAVRARDRALVLIGVTDADPGELAHALGSASGLDALDGVAARLRGCAHLVATVDGAVRAQGTASGVRQVFHADVDGVPVAADRCGPLARLIEAELDPAAVAAHALAPGPPWPLDERVVWRGVRLTPPGSALHVSRDGRVRVRRWWHAPEATLAGDDAARAVHDALAAAVRVRQRPTATVTCDLSGGMDSTSVAFLAARSGRLSATLRQGAIDPAHDDAVWATRAAARLTGSDHVVLDVDEAPGNLDPAPPAAADDEGPFAWQRARALVAHHARTVAGRGSTDHLTGHGGDELFDVTSANDHSGVRAGPGAYLARFSRNRHARRWSAISTLRHLADRTTYPQWLLAAGDELLRPIPEETDADESWGAAVRLAPWSTPAAVELARDQLAAAGRAGSELSPWRAQHMVIAGARACGAALRRCDQVTAELGVRWHAPMLDDRVVEAALATRFTDRMAADRYKPVLAAAMRDVVPPDVLGRPTKADFSADLYRALRRNRPTLLDWCDDLRLARLGLVDAAALRSALLRPHPTPPGLILLFCTLACESWLRPLPARAPALTAVRRTGRDRDLEESR